MASVLLVCKGVVKGAIAGDAAVIVCSNRSSVMTVISLIFFINKRTTLSAQFSPFRELIESVGRSDQLDPCRSIGKYFDPLYGNLNEAILGGKIAQNIEVKHVAKTTGTALGAFL